ncbi:MAG: TerB family tellurite resistance protein [Lentisphaeria bacterium]|nr:TerB family tellurite resistance protein [Lentisphaeria bacterium]
MGFGGAVIGGIIGGILGGGWGAAIGAVIGGMSGNNREQPQQRQLDAESPDGSLEAWKNLFRSFGRLAKSDGVVSCEEADMVSSFLRETGLPSAARKQLIAAFNEGKSDARPFRVLIRQTAGSFLAQAYPQIMTALCSIALADGKIDRREMEMLRDAESELGLPGFVDRWLKSTRGSGESDRDRGSESSDLTRAYQLLGVSPQCSDDEVKKAWRVKAKEYHPDRLRGKGVEESVIRLAEEQMRRVNDAYEQIKKARGF